MFEKIRYSYGTFLLKKQKPVKRQKQLCDLKNAKTVGIIFELTTEYNWKLIYQIYTELSKNKINVSMMGICYEKTLPNWIHKTIFPILQKKDFNLFFQPKVKSITSFCSKPFDILIDFSLAENIQNAYIVNHSKARMKVGVHHEEYLPYYDFVIKKSQITSFEEHLKNTMHYLLNLNTGSYDAPLQKEHSI